MLLTFSLFVGLAVIAVGAYVAFVLQTEIREATHHTLAQQAERIAVQIEQAEAERRGDVVRSISRVTDLRVSVMRGDTLLLDVHGGRTVGAGDWGLPAELFDAVDGRPRFAERTMASGRTMVYVALFRPRSELLISIGQPEPPLFALVRRLQVVLIVGMLMALILALLGSWVAAHQVTTPLEAVSASARRVSEGEFEQKIRVDTRASEFHDLARSINRMSDRFREKIDELQRLTNLQNEFIGNVSHEVRNPIFAVSGYLEALGSPSLTPAMRDRYAEKGLANLQRLNNLFNDLIEIAQLEYREDLLRPSIFELQGLIEEIAETLRPKAEERGLHLELENPPILVFADRNRIRQVLVNLIDNAIAYTDEGSVRVRYRRRLDKVRVEVVDTGRGIGEEHLDRVFERFYRVDPDRSRKGGGTGLGLSIVRQILHAHGEPIRVESTVNRGTRFWFELPYAEDDVDEESV
jgi:signal transduction histidine kinase